MLKEKSAFICGSTPMVALPNYSRCYFVDYLPKAAVSFEFKIEARVTGVLNERRPIQISFMCAFRRSRRPGSHAVDFIG